MVRILVVEDNVFLRGVFQENLELDGCEVYAAGSGLEALTLLRDSQLNIDLVVCDLTLPNMDAIVLYDALEEIHEQVKMLVLVRDPAPEAAAALSQRPGISWTDKRLSMDEFRETVREILDAI